LYCIAGGGGIVVLLLLGTKRTAVLHGGVLL
jgi:hypothetical protein